MGRDFLVDAARIGMCIRIIGGCGLGESVAGNRARVVDRAGGLAVARGILTDAVSARFGVGVIAGICVSDARGDDFAAIVGEGGAGKFVVVCGGFLVDANRDTGAMGVCGGRRGRALGKGIDAFIIGATGVRQADGGRCTRPYRRDGNRRDRRLRNRGQSRSGRIRPMRLRYRF